MPLYPSKVLRARERALTPCSFVVFYLGLTFGILKELGVRHEHMRIHDAIYDIFVAITLDVGFHIGQTNLLPQSCLIKNFVVLDIVQAKERNYRN
jgi:hypothetical protein